MNPVDCEEFYPHEKYPRSLIPPPRWHEKLRCRWRGHHLWRKFLWGGVHYMFDSDCCVTCRKMRGPLPLDRDTEIFPATMCPL